MIISSEQCLEHYGRLGMKWYQHIFTKDYNVKGGFKSKTSMRRLDRAAKAIANMDIEVIRKEMRNASKFREFDNDAIKLPKGYPLYRSSSVKNEKK